MTHSAYLSSHDCEAQGIVAFLDVVDFGKETPEDLVSEVRHRLACYRDTKEIRNSRKASKVITETLYLQGP